MMTAADEDAANKRREGAADLATLDGPAPYPTREEWAARQQSGPAELRRWLAHIECERLTREAAEREKRTAADLAASDRREEFAAGLSVILESEGLGFLAAHAVGWAEPAAWTDRTPAAVIEFDPAAVGLYPIRLELWHGGHDATGAPLVYAPGEAWRAKRPDSYQWASFKTPEAAMAHAARYCASPF